MLFLKKRAGLPALDVGLRAKVLRATALALAAVLTIFGAVAEAASCCGGDGSSGPTGLLGTFSMGRIDISLDWEKYDGFWNKDSDLQDDPPDSDLNQYRLNLGYAHRFNYAWQGYLSMPFVSNDNRYAGETTGGSGPGDMTVGLWWQAPSEWLYLGPSLLIPTGKSPFDDVEKSYDVTGRGFYRLSGNILVQNTWGMWDLSLSGSYGLALERSVNREYGKYVEPYHKQLGPRFSIGASAAHTWRVIYGTWTGSGGISWLKETEASIDGRDDPTSGFDRSSATAGVTYATRERTWTVKVLWNHGLSGRNFPRTDIYTMGVSYGF